MTEFKLNLAILCLLMLSGLSLQASCSAAADDDCDYPVVEVPANCSECHKAPPASGIHGPHPANKRCYRCHGASIDASFTTLKLHNNGTVEYAVGCSSCHGWNQGVSPPQNLTGECGQGLEGVGAHKAMRMSAIPVHQVACTNCHVVPLSTWAAGHIDGDGKAEVVFGNLAIAGGSQPVWDEQSSSCKNVYCHGATLKGGNHKVPVWTDTSGAASQCGACHSLADPDNNTAVDCATCHPGTVAADGTILPYGKHLNGVVDTAGAQ